MFMSISPWQGVIDVIAMVATAAGICVQETEPMIGLVNDSHAPFCRLTPRGGC